MANANGAGKPAPFKLGFSGSREWTDVHPKSLSHLVHKVVETVAENVNFNIEIHVGDADGIDRIVQDYALHWAFPLVVYGAHFEIRTLDILNNDQNLLHDGVRLVMPKEANDPKRGYHIRNEILVDSVDMIYGIWNGRSGGTKYTLDYAKKRGVRSHLLHITANGVSTIW